MSNSKRLLIGALLLAAVGCKRPLEDLTPRAATPAPYAVSDECELPAGGITGRVRWTDAVPSVPPISGLISTADGPRWGEMPNHHAPRIDAATKGVSNAVVSLKAVPSGCVKPWPYPPVIVDMADRCVHVRQGERTGAIGFVRAGDTVEMVSRDAVHHMLRARGSTQFTLAFPDLDQPLSRKFDTPGDVEFTSAAGYFWSSADVLVCPHPYFTTTDARGDFHLENVPDGEYEFVAWLRNWEVVGRDRDPESGKVVRIAFGEPFTSTRKAVVAGGKLVEVDFTLPAPR